ncbi:hypothetical protein vseg_015817 [Gypsophila vaccaria]
MKDDDPLLPLTTPSSSSSDHHNHNHNHNHGINLGKNGYKFWALAAILLLALWSMFTGTVTLRWSAGHLTRFSDDFDFQLRNDLDVLEMEEREKVVKYMWDVYTNNRRFRLPRFWQQAFEAAYEDMTSDAVGVRENAVAEIAKMSVRSIDLDPPPGHLTGARELSLKHAEIQKTATAGGNG